ncbi:cell cycle control protein 50A-like [Ixodes scapularis]
MTLHFKIALPAGRNLSGTIKPPNWQMPVNVMPGGIQNEAFIVWMRTATLPSLRKLYARVDHHGPFAKVMPKGRYLLEVKYRYPVTQFKGTKRLILSNASWMGSRNPFFGIAFISVGCLCVVLGLVFIAIHRKFGSKDHQLPELSAFILLPHRTFKVRTPSIYPLPVVTHPRVIRVGHQ